MHAHIPGAISLPLFSDAERALVGTAYKKQGKNDAVRLGIKIVGPKLHTFLEQVDPCTNARVYCWRGGMRSGFIRYFFDLAGIATLQLDGGYKNFRRFVLETLSRPYPLKIIGGYTGSGKTELLKKLRGLDLEALAQHRGSVFGDIPDVVQPSCEHFENRLALELRNRSGPIWVEHESRLIGRCQIPNNFYSLMQTAPIYVMHVAKEQRLLRIVAEYGSFSKEQLKQKTMKLSKRLGLVVTKEVLRLIDEGNLIDAFSPLLDYYDKAYDHALKKHKGPVIQLGADFLQAIQNQ